MEFNATFLATIVSFIIFVFLMNKILYAPILNIMEKRKNFIDDNYKIVEQNDEKIQKLNQKKEDKLIEARNEAKEAYNETINEFKTQKTEIITLAQNSAKEELEKSRIELENLSNETKENLIETGTIVKQGDVIGQVSTTNRQESKDGAHLHFEVKEDGQLINPEKYLVLDEK